jgi:hypothetical protein
MRHAGFKKNIYFSFTEGPFLGDDKSKLVIAVLAMKFLLTQVIC